MSSQQTTVLLATTLVVNALHIERLTCSKPDCLHAFAFCHGSSYIYTRLRKGIIASTLAHVHSPDALRYALELVTCSAFYDLDFLLFFPPTFSASLCTSANASPAFLFSLFLSPRSSALRTDSLLMPPSSAICTTHNISGSLPASSRIGGTSTKS